MARPRANSNTFAPQCRKVVEKAFKESELFIPIEAKNDRIGARTMLAKYLLAIRREGEEFQKEFDKWDGQSMKTRGSKPREPWFWDKMFWINQISVREDKERGGIVLGPKSMGKVAKALSSVLDGYEDGQISDAAIEASMQRFKEKFKDLIITNDESEIQQEKGQENE